MVLTITNLNKVYKNSFQALLDVNLEIKDKEKVALLGLNGAGKSSLVGILAGSVIKSSGEVLINNYDIVNNRIKATKSVGVVHQELIYDTFFTVQETLQLHAGYYGFENYQKEIEELLHALDLFDKKDINTRYLSGGMKRRLMIAKALITQPKLVILDEPSVGVDVTQRDKMYQYIDRLNKELGLTILLTTHYMEEAEKLCDRIIVIHKGRIVADGSKEEIIGKFQIKEIVFNLEFGKDEDISREQIISDLKKNKIVDHKFLFNDLYISYNQQDIDFDTLYSFVRKSNPKIRGIKSSEGSLELVFKKIIGD